MGNKQSMVTDIVNNASMTLTNDYVTKNVLNTDVSSTNIQDLTINIGIADGCPISTVQKISSKVSVKTEINQDQTKEFQAKLKGSLESALEQSSKMVNGLGAMTGGNTQDIKASIRNTINQSIINRVTTENIMNTAVNAINIQSGKLNMAVCRNSPISMEQGIESNVVAQNILTQITEDILKNEMIAESKATSKQTATMENIGFEAIANASVYCFAALAVVCCVAILAFLALGMSDAGQSAISKAGGK